VVDLTISAPGIYVAVNAGDWGGLGDTINQASTSGGGAGFSYRAAAPDTDEPCPLRFGTAFVTGVATNVLTLDGTGSRTTHDSTKYGYGFAQVGLVSSKILAPGPAVNDNEGVAGYDGNVALPIPYTGQNEYWTIALNCAKLASDGGWRTGPPPMRSWLPHTPARAN